MRCSFFILFSILFCGLSQGQSLELLNPLPSFQTGNDIHFLSNNHGFVVNNQEILETEDFGETWNIKQNIDSGHAIEFFNSKGYIVGDNGYVLQSNDSGNNWNSINIGSSSTLNSINLINEGIVIISGETEMFKTVDGGQNWAALVPPAEIMVKTIFTSELVGHTACEDGFIFKTIDGGQNWYITNSASTSPSDYYTIYFFNEQIGYASRQHSVFYKTTDGGETWVENPDVNDAIFDIKFNTENIGYIVGDDGAMFRTSNGGETWFWNSVISLRKDFSNIYGIHLIDDNVGFVTGQRGRIAKKDGGGWHSYSPTYDPIRKLQFVSGNVAYASNFDKFLKTTDGGQSWSNIGSVIPSANIDEFEFLTENIGYVVLSRSVFKTTDGGATWIQTNNGNQVFLDDISSMDFIDVNTGFVTTSTGPEKIKKTTDGGNTYEIIATEGFTNFQFINNNIAYGHKDFGNNTLYKSTDGGVTWSIMVTTGSFLNTFYFVDENVGFYGGENNLLGRTTDGGATWQNIGGIPNEDIDEVKFFNENEGFVADHNGRLYSTLNGGQNWEQLVNIGDINSISLFGSNVYIGGEWGRIMGTTNPLNINDFENQDNILVMYPNPVHDFLNLNVKENTLIETIKIYDIIGNLVFSSKENTKQLQLNYLVKGMYFIKIKTDKGNMIKKIIKE